MFSTLMSALTTTSILPRRELVTEALPPSLSLTSLSPWVSMTLPWVLPLRLLAIERMRDLEVVLADWLRLPGRFEGDALRFLAVLDEGREMEGPWLSGAAIWNGGPKRGRRGDSEFMGVVAPEPPTLSTTLTCTTILSSKFS